MRVDSRMHVLKESDARWVVLDENPSFARLQLGVHTPFDTLTLPQRHLSTASGYQKDPTCWGTFRNTILSTSTMRHL